MACDGIVLHPGRRSTIRFLPSLPGRSRSCFLGRLRASFIPAIPGIPNTLAPVGNLGFAPRVGFAWSPQAEPDSLLGKLLGGAGTTSIRASFGDFYTAIDALSIGVLAANAPYGTTYTSPAPPLFATPFITAANGQITANLFRIRSLR